MMHLLTYFVAILCAISAGVLAILFFCLMEKEADRARMRELLTTPQDVVNMHQHKSNSDMGLPGILARKFSQAGLEFDRRHLVAVSGVTFLMTTAAALSAGFTAAALAGILPILTGWTMLEYRATARANLFSDCMSGFLERIRQLLAVGNSLSVALHRAAENSPPIVMHCLAPALRRIDNGDGISESIERCATDLENHELHLLATAAHINLRFGGSMVVILRGIIENIRRRAAIERELRNDTTQIRASAWVLALLPIVVAGVVMLTNRTYANWFLATTTGHHVIGYAAASQLAGAWCMRLITRTRY